MPRKSDEHLDLEELEPLIPVPGEISGESLTEAQRHVEKCARCQKSLQALRKAETRLRKMCALGTASSNPGCPEEDTWLRVAAGVLSPEQGERIIFHAAQCDYCGPLLREALAHFSGDLSVEEEQFINQLSTARTAGEQALAEKMAGMTRGHKPKAAGESFRRAWPRRFAIRRVWALALSALLVAAALATLWWYRTGRSAEELLATAYTVQRTIELRIPGAAFGPLKLHRGPQQSQFSKPTALLNAEAIISQELRSGKPTALLLQEKGTAELLNGQPEAAVASLEQALALNSSSAPIRTLLAAALSERAGPDCQPHPRDCAGAIQYLSDVLAATPGNTVARYNRAILEERLTLFNEAVRDWEQLIRTEPDGAWLKDAQRRLQELKAQLKEHQARIDAPLLMPAALSAAASTPAAAASVNAHAEEYLDLVLKDWMPQTQPVQGKAAGQDNMRMAVKVVASLLASRHHDPWLSDVVATSLDVNLLAGFSLLSRALQDESAGYPAQALALARMAEQSFQAGGFQPGLVRAKLEIVYALHRLELGQQCLAQARSLLEDVNRTAYAWIKAQLLLELFSCHSITGDLDSAQRSAAEAVRIAEWAQYPILQLRGLGFLVSLKSVRDDPDASWSVALTGLTRFWAGAYPGVRANQIYSDLAYGAEDAGQWRLALILWHAALDIAPKDNHLFVAMTKEHLARIASRCGSMHEAEIQLGESQELLRMLPQNAMVRAQQVGAEVDRARLELDRGHNDLAGALLENARVEIPHLENSFVAFDYYETSGRLEHALGHDEKALELTGYALAVSESLLHSLKGEHDRMRWNSQHGAAYKEAVEILLAQTQQQQALDIWEWYRGAALRAGEDHTSSSQFHLLNSFSNSRWQLPSGGVRRLLPALQQQTGVVYVRLSRSYQAWVFDDRGISTVEIPDAERIDGLALAFGSECANPDSDITKIRRLGGQLYDLLIAPIEPRLDSSRTLIIESDGPAADIALQALQDGQNRFLGDKFRLVFAPAMAYMHFGEPQDSFSASDSVLIAATSGNGSEPGLAALPDLREEKQDLTSRFEHVRLIEGKDATIEGLRQNLKDARIFHFAGHALAGIDRNGLVMASSSASHSEQAEIVDGSRIEQMPLGHCRLIVLAACSTSRSKYGFGDPENLVRGFLRAGARHIVAARWDTDSRATESLVRDFYSRLLAGDSVSAALQSAAQAVRANSATAHPYYWAAFSVFGAD